LDNKGDIAMSNIETPDGESNEYLNLNSEELSGKLAQIKEALATEANSGIDAAELLGIETQSKNEEPVTKLDADEVAKLQEVIKFASEKLEKGGISTEVPTLTKMSEVEKQLADKQEKMAQAKFGEQLTRLSKLDKNLDLDLVKSLNMSTEDKVQTASVIEAIVQNYSEGITKLSSELESAQKQAESLAKFKAPEPEEIDGAEAVKNMKAKFGLSDEEKTE
jgi:hypothetical protein